MYADGVVDELFRYDLVGPDADVARVWVDDPGQADCVLIVPGGLAAPGLSVARRAAARDDIVCQVLVPSRLYPVDVDTAAAADRPGRPGGGGRGEHRRRHLGRRGGARCSTNGSGARCAAPVRLVHSADSVIPTAAHLERTVLVQDADIHRAVKEVVSGD